MEETRINHFLKELEYLSKKYYIAVGTVEHKGFYTSD